MIVRTLVTILILAAVCARPGRSLAQTSLTASRQTGAIIPAEGPRLAGYADGPWEGVNAVYQCPQFVATLRTNLTLFVQPIDNGTNAGAAVEFRFGASYTDPRLANKRNPNVARRVVALKNPPPPTLRASKIRLQGKLEDDVDFDCQISFQANKATIQCKFRDPKSQSYRTRFACVAEVNRLRIPDTLPLDEQARLMPGWKFRLTKTDREKLEVPYHRAVGLEAGTIGARELQAQGPWGKRTVTISSEGEDKKAVGAYFRHYPAYAPHHGYHMIWHLRDADSKWRGFTIAVQ
ncbi:MAG: hypothetical protein GX590_10735 [Lentisphaerae bacterium]|nr:hypothetical protein [Lentisphaerota bacterium]